MTTTGQCGLDGRTLNNAGVLTITSTLYIYNSAVLNNLAGGTLTLAGGTVNGLYASASAACYNAGSILTTGNSGFSRIAFSNSGAVELLSGSLNVQPFARVIHTGSFSCPAGVTLTFDSYAGTNVLAASSSVTGAGAVVFGRGWTDVNGTYNVTGSTTLAGYIGDTVLNFNPGMNLVTLGNPVSVSSGTVNFNTGTPLALQSLTLSSGILQGNDPVTVNGPLLLSDGRSTLGGSGVITANGGLAISPAGNSYYVDGRTLINPGPATITNAVLSFLNGGVLSNLAGATLTIAASTLSGYLAIPSATLYNAGTIRSRANSTFFDPSFNNSGTVEVPSGILRVSGPLSNAPLGSFNFPIVGRVLGSNYGQLSVSETFPLAGTLKVNVTNGFLPAVGDSFRILTWGHAAAGSRKQPDWTYR